MSFIHWLLFFFFFVFTAFEVFLDHLFLTIFEQWCSQVYTQIWTIFILILFIFILSNTTFSPPKKREKKGKIVKTGPQFYIYGHASWNTRTLERKNTVLCILVALGFPKSFTYLSFLYLHIYFTNIFFWCNI